MCLQAPQREDEITKKLNLHFGAIFKTSDFWKSSDCLEIRYILRGNPLKHQYTA
jgi:hypothetical protein